MSSSFRTRIQAIIDFTCLEWRLQGELRKWMSVEKIPYDFYGEDLYGFSMENGKKIEKWLIEHGAEKPTSR